MEAELMGAFAQFGVAGLIGWMWLSERRSTAERDRQLEYAHRRIKSESGDRDALVALVRDATRAMAAIEAGQRAMIKAIEKSCSGGCGGETCRGAA